MLQNLAHSRPVAPTAFSQQDSNAHTAVAAVVHYQNAASAHAQTSSSLSWAIVALGYGQSWPGAKTAIILCSCKQPETCHQTDSTAVFEQHNHSLRHVMWCRSLTSCMAARYCPRPALQTPKSRHNSARRAKGAAARQ
jgi:hypothetical protein